MNEHQARYELEREHHSATRQELAEVKLQLAAAEAMLDELTNADDEALLTISFSFLQDGNVAMNFTGNTSADDPISQVAKGLSEIHKHLNEMVDRGTDIFLDKEHGNGWRN